MLFCYLLQEVDVPGLVEFVQTCISDILIKTSLLSNYAMQDCTYISVVVMVVVNCNYAVMDYLMYLIVSNLG